MSTPLHWGSNPEDRSLAADRAEWEVWQIGTELAPGQTTCWCGSWAVEDYGTWCPSCERELWRDVGLVEWYDAHNYGEDPQ